MVTFSDLAHALYSVVFQLPDVKTDRLTRRATRCCAHHTAILFTVYSPPQRWKTRDVVSCTELDALPQDSAAARSSRASVARASVASDLHGRRRAKGPYRLRVQGDAGRRRTIMVKPRLRRECLRRSAGRFPSNSAAPTERRSTTRSCGVHWHDFTNGAALGTRGRSRIDSHALVGYRD